MPVQTGAMQRTRDARDIEDGAEHKLFKFFDVVVSRGFKSIVSWVRVGEVGLNL
jgi:hypothetical protein